MVDLSKMNEQELQSLHKRISSELEKREEQQRGEALQKIREIARSAGISPDELPGYLSSKKSRKKGPGKGKPGKYKNPANPDQTWTGRGRKPGWLIDALNSGKSLEDLAR